MLLMLVLLAVGAANGGFFYRSGGYQKFPVKNSCGSRLITWSPQREPRIIGGEIPPYGAIPWQVDIRVHGVHHCGGTIISKRLVVTAAHCWTEGMSASTGTHGPRTPYEQNLRVLKAVQHPEFRKYGPYSNDIAILLLEAPGFSYNAVVQPACIPDESPVPGTWCEVSGWGAMDATDPDRISPILRSAAVPLLSLEICRKDGIYGGRQQPILDTMLCAGRLKGGVDACGGDSGGPLVCDVNGKLELAGVVSWGDGCAKKDRPGVYTRISSYKKWIRNTARELGIEIQ